MEKFEDGLGRYVVDEMNIVFYSFDDPEHEKHVFYLDNCFDLFEFKAVQGNYYGKCENGKIFVMTPNTLSHLIKESWIHRLEDKIHKTICAIICPNCGEHADHTGYQYYPMDEQCKIL